MKRKRLWLIMTLIVMAAVDGADCYAQTSGNLVDDGVYYLYNQYDDNNTGDKNRFLARGKNYGTHAVVDKYGIPVRIINQGDDIVKLQFADGSNGYMKETWFLYTDGTENGNNTNTFKILPSTVDGVEGYHFATQQVSQNLDDKQYMYVWLIDNDNYYKVAGNANSPHNVAGNNVANDFTRTVWKLLTPAERNAIVAEYPGESLASVIDQARTGKLYPNLPPTETPASQYGYWIEAEYTAVDVPTSTWNFTAVRGNTGTQEEVPGLTELFQSAGTFTQTLTGLQNGIYRIALQAFERHGNTDNAKRVGTDYGNIGAAYMTANGQQVHIAAWHEEYTGTSNPNTMTEAAARFNNGHYVNEVFAYVTDGTLTISVTEPGYLGANWFIMKDALTVTYFSPTKKTVATPEGEYYLYNVGTQKYMTFDGYWGTYYSMSDVGKRLTLETSSDGFTLMHTTYLSNTDDVDSNHDTENYFYSYSGRKEHAFSNGNSHEGGEKWVFYQVGESDGKPIYNIMNFMTDYYLSGEEGYDTTNDSPGWGGKLKSTAADNDQTIQWQLVTKADLLAELQSIGNNESKDASFLIDEPDFIVGYNNVYKEFYKWKVMGNDQFKYSDWNTDNITTFYYDDTNGTSEGNCSYAYCLRADYPDILQTITGIPNGLYVVECQAVFRDGDAGATSEDPSTTTGSSSRKNADRLADGTYVNRAYLYANDQLGTEPTDARDKRDRYWIYENAQMMPVNVATDANFDVTGSVGSSLLTAFRDRQHTVQIPIYVTTDKLTIGVLQEIGINNNLLVFDRFRLKYYGTNYSGDEVKNIAKGNLERLQGYYTSYYQNNTITDPEKIKLGNAITAINNENNYNTTENVAKYNKAAQDYGETSINWYTFNVLKTDYGKGNYYTTATNTNRVDGRFPYVDEESKRNVVKYFGKMGNNQLNFLGDSEYPDDNLLTINNADLDELKAAIDALRTYVESNAEARFLENGLSPEEAKVHRDARMALVTGSAEAITTEDGKYPAYDTNPLMFSNAGVTITAPELNQIVHEARCWAPRDAYQYRFYDYTNYWYGTDGQEETYTIDIEGLMTGKYLVTISESHNNDMTSVKFNAYVGTGDNNLEPIVTKELFSPDESVWQAYTHSWQDVSCVVNITDQFEPVKLSFTGTGNRNGTMNICNLRIYRLDQVEMLLFDEDKNVLALNGKEIPADNQTQAYQGYKDAKALLKRTMVKGQWNTLTMPVSLSKEQVISAFGEGTIIATMNGFATDYGNVQNPDNCIHFTTNDMRNNAEMEIVMTEGLVYLIKPTADPAVSEDEYAKYRNSHENQDSYIDIKGPIYYVDYVDYYVSEGEKSTPATQETPATIVPHAAPTGGSVYPATGAQEGKLTLQMQGTYSQKVVPVNATADGGTNYIYAFQQQTDGNVYLVELDPNNSKSYEGFDGTGRLFKGYRGWAVANYKDESAGVRESYLVLLDEGDDQLTVIRGIDSEEGYSEVKIPRQGVYDLQGRSIDRKEFYSGSYPQGVYIVDGKKVVRK